MKRVHNSDIQCSVFATGPMGDEHICGLAARVWQQGSSLTGWPQAGGHCSAVEFVSEPVVPGDPLAVPGTVHRVVTEPVTVSAARRAGSVPGIDGVT